jgi:rhomboid family GlyGly-CTERM serine protease
MNAPSLANGLSGFLRSLNCDRGYGIGLAGVCLLLAIPELLGEPVRWLLSFDRAAIAAGQWWRLLTAHFVHLDLEHTVLNCLGMVLMWALFARDYSPWRWAAIYCGSALAVSLGLWLANPDVLWYVGASGALHGVMTAGTIAHLRRRDLDGWILTLAIVAKLSYEQRIGPLPFAGGDTLVDAHLYGAIGGCLLALLLNSRRQPA